MVRIPVSLVLEGRNIQGARMGYADSDMLSGPGRAVQKLGGAIGAVGDQFDAAARRNEAEQQQMEGYKSTLALEQWSNQQDVGYQKDLQSSAPDGSDFLAKRQENFQKSYSEFSKTITDPEAKAKADIIAMRIWGNQQGKAFQDVDQKRKTFYTASVLTATDQAAKQTYENRDEANQAWEKINAQIDASGLDDEIKLALKHKAGDYFSGAILKNNPDLIPRSSAKALGGAPGKAAAFFISRGYTPEQAAGIVGNLIQESGGGLRSTAVGDKGTAFGIAQWRGERLAALKRFAGARWREFDAQLAFIDHELNTSESGTGRAIKAARNVNDATAAAIGYERPRGWTDANPRGGHGFGNRLKNAHAVLGGKDFGGAQTASSPPADGPFQYMDAETWNKAQGWADQADRDAMARANAEAAAHKEAIDLGIETGDVADERAILDDPILDDGNKAILLRRFRERTKDKSETTDALNEYLSGTGTYNAFSSDDRQKLEKVDKAVMEAKPDMTDDEKVAFWTDMADRAGMVSNSALAWMRKGATSKNTGDVSRALSIADDIQQRAPQAIRSHDGGSQLAEDALIYRHYVHDLGYGADDAAKYIQELRNPENQRDTKTLEAKGEDIAKKFTSSNVLSLFSEYTTMGERVGYDDRMAEGITNDYRDMFRLHFMDTGNEEAAKALANADMRNTYGLSLVSGTATLMRYPPEKFMPLVGGTRDYLGKQVLEDARKATGLDLKEGDAFLWYNENTAAQARKWFKTGRVLPTYALYYYTEEEGQRVTHRAQNDFAVDASDVKRAQDAMREETIGTRKGHETLKGQLDNTGGNPLSPSTFNAQGVSPLFAPAQPSRSPGPLAVPDQGSGQTTPRKRTGAKPGGLNSLVVPNAD